MSKKAEDKVESVVMPVIEEMGFEYVGTEILKSGGETELIVYADKENGIGLEDCEKISRAIDPLIEELDPISSGYYLCVSSPGLDRPLKSQRDYKRSIGKKVDVKLYKPVGKQKNFTGELLSFDDEGFTLKQDKKEIYFLYSDTAIVRLHVDF